MEIRYTHKTISEHNVEQYHFRIDISEDRTLFFKTYSDLSGFVPNFDITQPREFIILGSEILANRNYIIEKIKENKKVKVFKKRVGGKK